MLSFLEKAFLGGYATGELNITAMFICILSTTVVALCICLVYRMVNKNSFYDRTFHLSLFALAVITSAIILTIQSNIVVSLGMVGALSIVRFRTAIKSPMDLMFLFWSISIGIICGAGYAMISVIASIVLTIGIILHGILPADRDSLILVVNAGSYIETEIMQVVRQSCSSWKVRARNLGNDNVNLAIEIKTGVPQELISRIYELEGVTSASLIEHDGDVTA